MQTIGVHTPFCFALLCNIWISTRGWEKSIAFSQRKEINSVCLKRILEVNFKANRTQSMVTLSHAFSFSSFFPQLNLVFFPFFFAFFGFFTIFFLLFFEFFFFKKILLFKNLNFEKNHVYELTVEQNQVHS